MGFLLFNGGILRAINLLDFSVYIPGRYEKLLQQGIRNDFFFHFFSLMNYLSDIHRDQLLSFLHV